MNTLENINIEDLLLKIRVAIYGDNTIYFDDLYVLIFNFLDVGDRVQYYYGSNPDNEVRRVISFLYEIGVLNNRGTDAIFVKI